MEFIEICSIQCIFKKLVLFFHLQNHCFFTGSIRLRSSVYSLTFSFVSLLFSLGNLFLFILFSFSSPLFIFDKTDRSFLIPFILSSIRLHHRRRFLTSRFWFIAFRSIYFFCNNRCCPSNEVIFLRKIQVFISQHFCH